MRSSPMEEESYQDSKTELQPQPSLCAKHHMNLEDDSLYPSRYARNYATRRKSRRRSIATFFLLSFAFGMLHSAEAFGGIRKWASRRRIVDPSATISTTASSYTTGTTDIRGIDPWVIASSANNNNKNQEDDRVESWSNSAPRKSSPLQVRKRVRAVLEKARTRTGIDNTSSDDNRKRRSSSSVVAEAASIGGLIDEDVVIQIKRNPLPPIRNGTNSTTNGATNLNGKRFVEEELVVEKKASSTISNGKSIDSASSRSRSKQRKPQEFDVIRGDAPAAAKFIEPLPFKLPVLSSDQKRRLESGERIQEQARMGREGSGYVVVDIDAPPYVVWECLLDFESYTDIIPTVRDMQLYTSKKLNIGYVNETPVPPGTKREIRHYGTPSITRAAFILSKFRLNIAAIHRYTPHPEGDYMVFTLDKSCTNIVLKGAKGIWHVEENPDGREGVSRVYLLCEVQISRALPSFIVDYAAERAMPRATTWLKPQVEAAAELWLKPQD